MVALQASIGTLNDLVDAPARRRPQAGQADPGRARRPCGSRRSRVVVAAVVGLLLRGPVGRGDRRAGGRHPGDRVRLRPVREGHRLVVAAVRGRDPAPAGLRLARRQRATCPASFAILLPAGVARRGGPGRSPTRRPTWSATRPPASCRSPRRLGPERAWTVAGGPASAFVAAVALGLAGRGRGAAARRRGAPSPGRRSSAPGSWLGRAQRPRTGANAPGSSQAVGVAVLAVGLARRDDRARRVARVG